MTTLEEYYKGLIELLQADGLAPPRSTVGGGGPGVTKDSKGSKGSKGFKGSKGSNGSNGVSVIGDILQKREASLPNDKPRSSSNTDSPRPSSSPLSPSLPPPPQKQLSPALAMLADGALSDESNVATLRHLRGNQIAQVVQVATLFTVDPEAVADRTRIGQLFLAAARQEALRLKCHHDDTKDSEEIQGRLYVYLYKTAVVRNVFGAAPSEEVPYKAIVLMTARYVVDGQHHVKQELLFRYDKVALNIPMDLDIYNKDSESMARFLKDMAEHFTEADRLALVERRVRLEFRRVRPSLKSMTVFDEHEARIVRILQRMGISKHTYFKDAQTDTFKLEETPEVPVVPGTEGDEGDEGDEEEGEDEEDGTDAEPTKVPNTMWRWPFGRASGGSTYSRRHRRR